MSKNEEHSQKQAHRKWPWIVLLSLVALIGLARLALMTTPVHHWVKNIIVDTANKSLKPHLSVGRVSGDLWSTVTLTDITLAEEDTVASVDTLHVEYSLLSYFSDAFKIHQVQIIRPQIQLQQQADSTWNVQHWITTTDTSSSSFTFMLSDLSIKSGRVDVHTVQLPTDSSFVVDDLNLAASIGYYGDSYNAGIDDLSFNIKQTQLGGPVSVQTAAQADEQSLTLQQLAISTAHSLLQASGNASLADSSAHFKATAKPLGWKDLAAYADSLPVQKDLNLSLMLNGNSRAFKVKLLANADGINQLALNGTFQYDSTFVGTSFEASAKSLNFKAFMGDTTMPSLQNLTFKAEGRVPFNDYQQTGLKGTLLAENVEQGSYRLDAVRGSFSLNDSHAELRLVPQNNGEQLVVVTTLSQIWGGRPTINLTVSGSDINPAQWMPEDKYNGHITFNGHVSGTGWVPEHQFWKYELALRNSSLMDQPINSALFSGQFNQQSFTNNSQISLAQSTLQLHAQAQHLQSVPAFSYSLQAHNLDVSNVKGLEKYPSSISGRVEGKGQGSTLQNLRMQLHASIDSSNFKGESINTFSLDADIEDSVVTVDKFALKSAIADGDGTGRINLRDLNNRTNTLHINLTLKDLSSFASMADVEILQARGNLQGDLRPVGKDSLVFDGETALTNINYNKQFIAPEISGSLRMELQKEPKFLVDININQPTIASYDVQNIKLKTEGQLGDKVTSGSFELKLAGAREGKINQSGSYRLSSDSVAVKWTAFDLTSSLRTLSLQRPFHATFARGALQTDTLQISSKDDSAYMQLSIPYADSLHQQAYLKAKSLNLQAIQDAILDEPYFKGILQAQLNLDRTDTSMTASGRMIMSDLQYNETKLDTLRLQADIRNERLKGSMKLYQNSELIAEGDADIPFKAKAPAKLDNDFLSKPVNGHLTLHSLKLDRFNTLLEQAGYENTTGTIQFDGSLEGQAGQPKLNARLSLKDATLSGVPIDSLIASAHYNHAQSKLDLNATLTSLKQKALELDALMPLNVNLKNLDVSLPGPQDSISVDVHTNDFNLKALNDFVDRSTARNIKGSINGDIKIRGPRSDLQASGQLKLNKGVVRVVKAGIQLDHIQSTIQFEPDKIVLQNFHTESGKGSLNAEGSLGLEQLVPGDLDITVKAQNFKAANTDQYNALVNLNMDVGGRADKPRVSGKLEVIHGFIELDNFGQKSVEQVQLDTTLAPATQTSLYDSLSLDMDIVFNQRFFVRNQRYLKMEIEVDGSLNLQKESGGDLQIFGTLNTPDGYAEPLGKRFELQEGTLAFSGPPANPQINVRTLYEPPQSDQEIKIWYTIEGTVEDPQFKYESSPQMDLAGIISYTLFGQPFYKLNPAEQTVAGSSSNNAAADIAMDVLMDRLESVATRRLGIDVVRIENTRVGGKSGTSVTTGWYVNPKVFFAIQNVITGSTPTTGFYLEYYLKKHLKLILSQGNDNRQGIDLQWEHDY